MNIQAGHTPTRFDPSAILSGGGCRFCVGCSHCRGPNFKIQGDGLCGRKKLKTIPLRFISLDDLRVVTIEESSFLGMKAILMRKE